MHKLISFGEVLVDQIEQTKGAPLVNFAGGAPANVAACYAKLGGKSLFIGGVGADDNAKFLLSEFERTGVNTNFIKVFKQGKTATTVVTLDEYNERSFEFNREDTADTLFRAQDLDEQAFKQSLFFHFCSNTLTHKQLFEATQSALELAQQNQLLVCFDVNLRLNLWPSQSIIRKSVAALIPYCQILKMSSEELDYLTNQEQTDHTDYLSSCFNSGVNLILITNGKNTIYCHTEKQTIRFNPPSISAQDTTGAGDAFIGSFLWHLSNNIGSKNDLSEYLYSEDYLNEVLAFAATCGAITCQSKGVFSALPNLRGVDQFISNFGKSSRY